MASWASCRELEAYAVKRLSACVFRESKPTCQNCPIKCYKPAMRVQMAAVMRYAGPRMLLRHPYWALRHLLDGFKSAPVLPKRTNTRTVKINPDNNQ